MSDIKTIFIGQAGACDYDISHGDLTSDNGLQTAVIISLFTDRRAEDDDILPDGTEDRRGWWADAFTEIPGDQIGSRLWLLSREKQMTEVLRKAEEYAQEALQWLLDDGIANGVNCTAEIIRKGTLGLYVDIDRPDQVPAQYHLVWEAHLNAV